jgi:tripartite ATP-independent transporter DctM subunit
MEMWQLALILLGALLVFLAVGLPVAFTMGGLSLIIGYFVWGGTSAFYAVALGTLGKVSEFTLIAVPLFLLMAALLQYSGLAEDMYEMIYRWMGNVKGGLAIGTVIISAIFAAMVGIATVATATLGLTALPSMLKRGYDKRMICGAICAGGALGVLIPPSVLMIIYASETDVSAGQMFFAGIMPGILLAVLYIIYIAVRCAVDPAMGPSLPPDVKYSRREKMASLRAVYLPLLLIALVLGVIYFGVATPTEAAAVGCVGAFFCAGIRRQLTFANVKKIFHMCVSTNAMVFWIVIGAVAYSRLVTVSGVGDWFSSFITGLPVNRWSILIMMQAVFFVLGMVLDPAGILYITAPFFIPTINALGFDLVWYGILWIINMNMAYLTPPFGFALFILQGVAPPEVSTEDIYIGIWPYVGLQIIGMALVISFPAISTWLPGMMIK